MKKVFWIWSILLLANPMVFSQSNDDVYYSGDDYSFDDYDEEDNAANSSVDYQTFHDELSPYGTWMDYPAYGNVWVPNAPTGFSPYLTGGQWAYTQYGWTWASDYNWGWAPFHYGRWMYDSFYGWVWVPGYDWAPAWVVWGDYNNYYCWAPIGPGAVISPAYRPDAQYWNFVPRPRIAQPNPSQYVVHRDALPAGDRNVINQRVNIISRAETYNQSVFFAGPQTRDVEKYTGGKIERTRIVNVQRPAATTIKNNEIPVYRPATRRAESGQQQVTPNNNNQTREVSPSRGAPANRQLDVNTQPTNVTPRNVEIENNRGSWTPPRQNIEQPVQQPQRQQYNPQPVPQQERNFIPTEQPQMRMAQPNLNTQPARSPTPGRGGPR